MSGRFRSVAVVAAAMLVLAPSAQAAGPTLATITAHLRTSAQYDDPAAKVTAAQKTAITKAINAARLKGNIVRVAILAAAPPDAPGTTAALRLRARLKLAGHARRRAADERADLRRSTSRGKRLAGVRAAVAGKGAAVGALAAINAITSRVRPRSPVRRQPSRRPRLPRSRAEEGSHPGSTSPSPPRRWRYRRVLTGLRVRTRRVRRRGGGSLIEGARTLLQGRLEGSARRSRPRRSAVSEREDPALTNHHRNAAETVAEVRGSIGRLDGPPAFRAAHGRLDDAEWHLGSCQAHSSRSASRHGRSRATRALLLQRRARPRNGSRSSSSSAGVRTVSVGICAADAVRLTRGDEPEIRAVTVGRRRLPWAAAPTWYGRLGLGPGRSALAPLPRPAGLSRRRRSSTPSPSRPGPSRMSDRSRRPARRRMIPTSSTHRPAPSCRTSSSSKTTFPRRAASTNVDEPIEPLDPADESEPPLDPDSARLARSLPH